MDTKRRAKELMIAARMAVLGLATAPVANAATDNTPEGNGTDPHAKNIHADNQQMSKIEENAYQLTVTEDTVKPQEVHRQEKNSQEKIGKLWIDYADGKIDLEYVFNQMDSIARDDHQSTVTENTVKPQEVHGQLDPELVKFLIDNADRKIYWADRFAQQEEEFKKSGGEIKKEVITCKGEIPQRYPGWETTVTGDFGPLDIGTVTLVSKNVGLDTLYIEVPNSDGSTSYSRALGVGRPEWASAYGLIVGFEPFITEEVDVRDGKVIGYRRSEYGHRKKRPLTIGNIRKAEALVKEVTAAVKSVPQQQSLDASQSVAHGNNSKRDL